MLCTNWTLAWAHVYISKQFPSLGTPSVTAWTQLVHICEQVSFQVGNSNLYCSAAQHSNKTWLFNALYNNSRFTVYRGLRTQQALKKGYTLAIPGSWQRRYDPSSGISVIGGKSGGMTAQVFRKNRKHFISLYQDLQCKCQFT